MVRAGSCRTIAAFMTASLLSFGVVAGCQRPAGEAPESAVPVMGPGPIPMPVGMPPPVAAPMGIGIAGTGAQGPGRTLFTMHCARCHTAMGAPMRTTPAGPIPSEAKGPVRGPDVLHVAADPKHTRQWLIEQIRDPQAHKADAAMPKFAGRLKDKEIDAIADYLSTMR
jgi:mono/diheme cytochrome c family protein